MLVGFSDVLPSHRQQQSVHEDIGSPLPML